MTTLHQLSNTEQKSAPHISITDHFVVGCSSVSIVEDASILSRSANTRVGDVTAAAMEVGVMHESSLSLVFFHSCNRLEAFIVICLAT